MQPEYREWHKASLVNFKCCYPEGHQILFKQAVTASHFCRQDCSFFIPSLHFIFLNLLFFIYHFPGALHTHDIEHMTAEQMENAPMVWILQSECYKKRNESHVEPAYTNE